MMNSVTRILIPVITALNIELSLIPMTRIVVTSATTISASQSWEISTPCGIEARRHLYTDYLEDAHQVSRPALGDRGGAASKLQDQVPPDQPGYNSPKVA